MEYAGRSLTVFGSGFSFSWRSQFVGLRFSLAYGARRSTRWEISDFPRGGRPWRGSSGDGELGGWSVCGPHLELVLEGRGVRGEGRACAERGTCLGNDRVEEWT